jgi:ATP-dependent helicase HrpB
VPIEGQQPAAQYPVEAVLGDLLISLNAAPNVVLIAPPGAGKTTIVPPVLLQQKWCNGQIIVLSPRRIAARMAAERMAELAQEPVGKCYGYVTRMDSKISPATRVLVMTEGIFRNQIIADPELSGISAVVFDEVHERNLDSDFGLALALEAQAAFRPDLRLIAMSATLDGAAFSQLMGDAPVIESAGKSWPLEIQYVGRRAELPIEAEVARIVRQALHEQMGDILVFLPGAREIERTAQNLDGRIGDAVLHKLHGSLDPAEQRAALRPNADGLRKVILATNIAETSLTIEGVRIVVDSGLARRARFDQSAGVTRLVTERVSQSAATQRAGRAARQGAGVAYRMWKEAGHGGLPPFDPPQILESDLSGLVLQCALWGEAKPENLHWLDPPPKAALNEAGKLLRSIAALDNDGAITAHGRNLAQLPLPVNLAHMIVQSARHGQQKEAALIAQLIQDRNAGGQGVDIEQRLQRFRGDHGDRADRGARASAIRRSAERLAAMVTPVANPLPQVSIGALIAFGFPDRLSRRRDAKGESWISVMGRGLRLVDEPQLAKSQWLAIAEMQGAAASARIVCAAPMTEEEVEAVFGDRINVRTDLQYDANTDRITSRNLRILGAIKLAETPSNAIDPVAAAQLLLRMVGKQGLSVLPWSPASLALRQRGQFAGFDGLSDTALLENIDDWLLPTLEGKKRLIDIHAGALHTAIEDQLSWTDLQQIEKIAPSHFTSPAGSRHAIDYAAMAGPSVELRIQAMFGLDIHPLVGAQKIPLLLSLTSPAGRPIQTTADLPAFWRGSWRDVAKEMRGRYPRHVWPDAPWDAVASLKTKNAQARS